MRVNTEKVWEEAIKKRSMLKKMGIYSACAGAVKENTVLNYTQESQVW